MSGRRVEVELKAPVDDLAALRRRLDELGAERRFARVERDAYYAHPARDFAATDEALRVRRVGETQLLCYKGPKLDAETKSREEVEFPVPAAARTLLERLGFRVVAEVVKRRELFRCRGFEVSLDRVEGVGDYAEVEVVCAEAEFADARRRVRRFARRLGLEGSERRSYLELLLEGRGGGA